MSNPLVRLPRITVPIIKGERLEDGRWDLVQEYGTAFYLGNKMFMTAAHCLAEPPDPYFLFIVIPAAQAGPNGGRRLRDAKSGGGRTGWAGDVAES